MGDKFRVCEDVLIAREGRDEQVVERSTAGAAAFRDFVMMREPGQTPHTLPARRLKELRREFRSFQRARRQPFLPLEEGRRVYTLD